MSFVQSSSLMTKDQPMWLLMIIMSHKDMKSWGYIYVEECKKSCIKFFLILFLVEIMHVKLLKWSKKSFDMLFKLLKDTFPNGTGIPTSYYGNTIMLLWAQNMSLFVFENLIVLCFCTNVQYVKKVDGKSEILRVRSGPSSRMIILKKNSCNYMRKTSM